MSEPVAALSEGFEGVRGSLHGLDDKELVQLLREVEQHERETQSVTLDLVAEIDSRGVAAGGVRRRAPYLPRYRHPGLRAVDQRRHRPAHCV